MKVPNPRTEKLTPLAHSHRSPHAVLVFAAFVVGSLGSRWFCSTCCPPFVPGPSFELLAILEDKVARSPCVPQGESMPRPPTGGPPLRREGAAVGFRGRERTTRGHSSEMPAAEGSNLPPLRGTSTQWICWGQPADPKGRPRVPPQGSGGLT